MDLNENTYRTRIDWKENRFQDQQSSSIQVKEDKQANEPKMEGGNCDKHQKHMASLKPTGRKASVRN